MWTQQEGKRVGSGIVTYLRPAHGHEGGHEVHVDGVTVRVLPDGATTTRARAGVIREALTTEVVAGGARVAYLVGRLVLAGATNLEVDGKPLIPRSGGRWRLDLAGDGEVRATWLGGDR